MSPNSNDPEINRLMTAVVQEQDVDSAQNSIASIGINVTRLPSTGGFLGRRNATLLIGLNDSQVETVIRILGKTCRQRVEYVATPLEGSPLPFPSPTPITVGGATIFTFEVEHYREF